MNNDRNSGKEIIIDLNYRIQNIFKAIVLLKE